MRTGVIFALLIGVAVFHPSFAYAFSVTEIPNTVKGWVAKALSFQSFSSLQQSAFVFGSVVENSPFVRSGTDVILRTVSDFVGIGEANPAATLEVQTNNASDVGFIVQGTTSQSANLQEWQDSGGNVLSVVDENGYLGIGTDSPRRAIEVNLGTTTDGLTLMFYGTRTSGSGAIGMKFANLNTSGASFISLGEDSDTSLTPSYISRYGSTSARANDVELFTSSGGDFVFTSSGSVGIGDISPDAKLDVVIDSSAKVGQIIQGAASQSADLLQLQDSGGNVLAGANKDGTILLNGDSTNTKLALAFTDDLTTGIYQAGASQFTFYAGGTGSFTAKPSGILNFVSWRAPATGNQLNVKGAVVAGTDSDAFYVTNERDLRGNATTKLFSIYAYQSGSTNFGNLLSTYGNGLSLFTGQTEVDAGASTTIASIVKGAVSQTANLQEWQNSSGTPLGSINSSGQADFSLYKIGGTSGLSATMNVMSNDGVTPCTITVSGGIITATTCP